MFQKILIYKIFFLQKKITFLSKEFCIKIWKIVMYQKKCNMKNLCGKKYVENMY